MKKVFYLLLLLSCFSLQANEQSSLKWQADGGEIAVYFFYDLLNDYGIAVDDGIIDRHPDWTQNELKMPIRNIGGLNLYVPYDGLKGVTSGELSVSGQFSWSKDQWVINFADLSIRPTSRTLKAGELTALEVVNDAGEVMFYLDHIHAGFNAQKTWVEFNNMDLRASKSLAKKLNMPFLDNLVVGHAHMKNHVVIPVGYTEKLDANRGTCVADDWPSESTPADIQLIAMQAQYVRSIGSDHVVFTPSATLKNISQADVAWYRKFSGTFPPYNNDQHPYLSWSMYRRVVKPVIEGGDDRFEQIGVSGIKHAFFTVNTNCSCSGGQVIFPTCEDTYSVGNNDGGSNLGPHHEISSADGVWQSTGSFFDQDNNGVQETSSNGTDENRMVVAEADFADASLDYYISSWYTIRDDINIFNSMGFKGYSFTANGDGWFVNATTPFTNGPASDQYVTPDTVDLNNLAASARLTRAITPAIDGHLTVAVRVVDLGAGMYRYNYMVENHDYDPQVQTIEVPLNQLNSMTNLEFSDVDELAGNDWSGIHNNGVLTLQAPAGNAIDWGHLYSFSFTSDAAPQLGDVTLTGLDNGSDVFSAAVIVPAFDDLIFENGFE